MMRKSADGKGFADLGLEPALLTVLAELGYEEPTPIQRDAIPPLLEGRDLAGQAATGTGKTAAFALPLVQRLFAERRGNATGPALLVLVPTRELAMQVAEAIHRYGKGHGVRVLPVYGGQSLVLQFRALKRGLDAVVATPGRALDHLRRGTLQLGGVAAVVLDEADEMLDMGFAEDLETILQTLPKDRQIALFSATMPRRIAAIAERHLRNPARIHIVEEKAARGVVPRVRQVAYVVSRAQKVDALSRILDLESPASALVFCRTRVEVEDLAQTLGGRGYRAEALHGGMSQRDRDRVMGRFRAGKTELLLATDVAARGLDIGHLSHVFNYDVPSAAESYVHRIGRTGRAGREGVAITLVEPRERHMLQNVERMIGRKLDMATVPTVADLRARRMEVTRATLREAILAGGSDAYRVVVESLAQEFDVLTVAAAAVQMAHEAGERPDAGEAEVAPERPMAGQRPTAPERPKPTERPKPERPKPERPKHAAPPSAPEPEHPPIVEKPRTPVPRATKAPTFASRIYISAGRTAGVRPGDLVGAITGEAGIKGTAIGAIEIDERFSLVEVADDHLDTVLAALRKATIRGQKVTVSLYQPKAKKKKS